MKTITYFKVHMKRIYFLKNFTVQYVNELTINVKVPSNKKFSHVFGIENSSIFVKKWSRDWDEFIVQFQLVT